MIQQITKLNLIPNNKPIVINVNQNDTGDGRLIFEMDVDVSGDVVIQGTTKHGTFTHPALLNGRTVTADLESDMTSADGDTFAQLVFTDGDNRAGSQVFILRVQKEAKE